MPPFLLGHDNLIGEGKHSRKTKTLCDHASTRTKRNSQAFGSQNFQDQSTGREGVENNAQQEILYFRSGKFASVVGDLRA